MRFCSAQIQGKLMKSYRISPRKLLSAFSTAENRLCRTLVRRRDDFRRFCIFFISPRAPVKPRQHKSIRFSEIRKVQSKNVMPKKFSASHSSLIQQINRQISLIRKPSSHSTAPRIFSTVLSASSSLRVWSAARSETLNARLFLPTPSFSPR